MKGPADGAGQARSGIGRWPRPAFVLAVAVLLGWAGAGCGGSSGSAPTASTSSGTAKSPAPASGARAGAASSGAAAGAGKLTPVKIAVTSKSAGYAFLYVGKDMGIFKRYGLDPQIVAMKIPAMIAALDNGEIDFTSPIGSVVEAAERGLPFRVVFVGRDHPLQVLMGAKGYTKFSQAKGQQIASSNPNSAVDAELVKLLGDHGLKPSDYTTVSAGNDPARAAALVAGQYKFASMNVVFAMKLINEGYPMVGSTLATVDYPDGGLVTSLNEIKTKASLVRRTVQASLAAVQATRNDRAQVVPIFEKEYRLSAANAKQLFNLLQPTYSLTGRPSQAALQFEAQMDQRFVKMPKLPDMQKYYDLSFTGGSAASGSATSGG